MPWSRKRQREFAARTDPALLAGVNAAVAQGVRAYGGWGTVLDRMWAGLEQGWNLSQRGTQWGPSLAEVSGPNIPAIRPPYPDARFGFGSAGVVTTNQEAPMNVFQSGGASGGFDWGGMIATLGGQVAGIFQAKEQNKMLRRLSRGMGRTVGSGSYGGFPVNTFAPAAGVPAAVGGAWAGTAGGLLGAGALGLLPELADMLPGGMEESGTGIFGPDLFAVGANSRRQRMIDAVHPTTGERVYWRPVGRPIMFTGDAALLKRTRKMVRKMSTTAGCGVAGRFRRRRR